MHYYTDTRPSPDILHTQPHPAPRHKGYFHSTRLMQALRTGLLSVRQNSALGGRLFVEPPCFLLLAYCCLFLWDSRPAGATAEPDAPPPPPARGPGGPGLIVSSDPAASPWAWRAAVMAACQARTGLTPDSVVRALGPPEPLKPATVRPRPALLVLSRPRAEPTGLPALAGGWGGPWGWESPGRREGPWGP